MEQATSTKHGGEPNPLDTTGLCLLSLDGGGVRGFSTLYILKSIMDRLNHELKKNPPMKPCEVFDLIGGTSTGGLIAIMLGRLEMGIDECIATYSDLAAAVFGEKLHHIPINIKGGVKPRFDSARLESAIQKAVAQSDASGTDMFNDGTERGCRTFVCSIDRDTKDMIRLRSYSLPDEPSIHATICQAALATSAATSFFDPVSIGDRTFADGGFGANNPVDEVEGEAANIWCSETGDLKPLVKCFISIGTGNPGKKAFEGSMFKFLGETVVQIATETEATEKKFIARWAKHFDEKRYFRFNVEQGLQNIGLEEYKKKGAIEAASEGYLTHMAQKFRVRDCIQNLWLKQNKPLTSFAALVHEYTIRIIRQQSGTISCRAHIIDWLQALDSPSDLDRLSMERLEGTGIWLLGDERFQEWQKSSSALWVYGKSGSGKSVLSSLAIQHIKDMCSRHQGWGFAYHFFSNISVNEKATVSGWLTASVKQLISQNDTVEIPQELQQRFKRRERPTITDLSQSLRTLINSFSRTYLVFDALDECSDREILLKEIQRIIPTTDTMLPLHLLITSRPENDFKTSLADCTKSISLQTDLVQADIQYYTSQILATDRKFKAWEDGLKDDVRKALIDKADGTFRWVSLQIIDLRGCRNKRDIQKTLKSLPRTLAETYARILSQIDPKDQAGCRNMLHLLATSTRPLTVNEVAELFVIDVEHNQFDVDARFIEPNGITEICPGLIEITTFTETKDNISFDGNSESGFSATLETPSLAADQYVKLTHASVLDYLVSCRDGVNSPLFGFETGSANFLAAKLCLLYVIAYNEESVSQRHHAEREFQFWEAHESSAIRWPLLSYASKAWQIHWAQFETSVLDDLAKGLPLSGSRKSESEILDTFALRLFKLEGDSCLQWTSAALAQGVLENEFTGTQDINEGLGLGNGLFFRSFKEDPPIGRLPSICLSSAMCGCKPILSHLQEIASARSSTLSTKPRLSELIRKDDGAVLRLIYEAMSNPSSSRWYRGSQEAILRNFLQYILGIGFRDPGSLALISGAAKGDTTVVDLLLQLGVDVYAPDGYNEALYTAASSNPVRREVIELLLERGADPNTPTRGLNWVSDVSCGTLLWLPAMNDETELVELLIQHGANVNSSSDRFGEYGGLLHSVAIPRYFHKDWQPLSTMKQLITHGARLFPQHAEYQRYLQRASSSEVSKHLQVLKKAGAKQEDGRGIRPLDCQAIWAKHRELKATKHRELEGERDLWKGYGLTLSDCSDIPEGPDELEWLQEDTL